MITLGITSVRAVAARAARAALAALAAPAAPAALIGSVLSIASPASGQTPSLAEFFGFDGLEIVKIDANPGPLAIADMNGDGHNDLVVANNRKSRIEIHYFKPGATPDDEQARPAGSGVNEIPEHWRFRREVISVSHQVTGIAVSDIDSDGRPDIVYAGNPPTIVMLRQKEPGEFEVFRRHNVKGLAAGRDGFAIADVTGDSALELIAMVGGRIRIWPLNGGNLGTSSELAGGGTLIAFLIEDFDGDGRNDFVGIIPDDPAPVRLWLAGGEKDAKAFGPQLRFEMPVIREACAIRFPDDPAAKLGVIEAVSKRIVVLAAEKQSIPPGLDGDAAMRVYAFRDGSTRKRSTAVADVDGDGRDDLLATDIEGNAVVVYRQFEGKGLDGGTPFPAYAEMTYLVAGNVDDDPQAEVFVLSQKEGVVGRMDGAADGTLTFPQAVAISAGHTPVAATLVELDGGMTLAVVAKDGRNYVLDLINTRTNETTVVDLGSQSREPETIVALDADQDGRTDLLLFTPEKPMQMLRSEPSGFKLLESRDMGQFGLVQAAEARNTETFDVDGDGRQELLIADRNFIRAVRYVAEPPAGVSPGWQVVTQINAEDPSTKLVSLAIRSGDSPTIAAADQDNSRLLTFARKASSDSSGGASGGGGAGSTWTQNEALDVRGFKFTSIQAGSFSGDGRENLLAIGDDGFAIIQLGGERVVLSQIAAWRTDIERRRQHEMLAGDVNSDGFVDLVMLDDGEQMCEILTFTESRRLLYATGFQVFESKIFSGGATREAQPSQVFIDDVTGDDADDIILISHDRLLIYPQMKKP